MPLDGHSYLVAQGWTGSGTGLRQGAISRPLVIPQKKSLAGLGKERDEAFPFWDHLFSAASKSIQIHLSSDEDSDAEPNAANVSLKRTSTGILSNRRPAIGAPAESSGSTTPDIGDASPGPRLSLLATAKREAAKRGLYSRFFRGPVIGPDSPLASEPVIVVAPDVDVLIPPPGGEAGPSKKKRKVSSEGEDERRERKRLRRERKEVDKAERKAEKKALDKAERNSEGKHRRKRKPEAEEGKEGTDDKESEESDKARRKRERKEKRSSEATNSAEAEGEPKRKRKRPIE
ncbi:hypothetical protein B0H17DRAFT_930258 [Mycena rosella]|uniref:G-patch domain-containing protein n=1 Tax=Mycena rosella TaxID=1033263 RepID=A0AAD7DQ88_MYCRO|nr:hypothetical protein B0H17DRAFT_930258 [Mycena rosella]